MKRWGGAVVLCRDIISPSLEHNGIKSSLTGGGIDQKGRIDAG